LITDTELRGQTPQGGPTFGPPGTGKTGFIKSFLDIARKRDIKTIAIGVKDCFDKGYTEFKIPEIKIVRRISSIMQFTAYDGFRVSFDLLALAPCETIDCLIAYAEKEYREEIAKWVSSRLRLLKRFASNDIVRIPLCLGEDDEGIRRLIVGILYVIRSYVSHLYILDDALSYIINMAYLSAWIADSRPFLVSLNYYAVDPKEILRFNPVIISPGGHAGYFRLAHPDKYVVIFDDKRWEIDKKEIEKLAYS
jgi:hypothetical protein